MNQKGVIEDRAPRYRELRREYEQAKESGKTAKIWRAASDETGRDSHVPAFSIDGRGVAAYRPQ